MIITLHIVLECAEFNVVLMRISKINYLMEIWKGRLFECFKHKHYYL